MRRRMVPLLLRAVPPAPKDDKTKEQNVNSSAYSDFASGSFLSESSSWDDIFAYMDI